MGVQFVDSKKFDSLSRNIGRRGALKTIGAGALAAAASVGILKSSALAGDNDPVGGETNPLGLKDRRCTNFNTTCQQQNTGKCEVLLGSFYQGGVRYCKYNEYRCNGLDNRGRRVCDTYSMVCDTYDRPC